VIKPKHCPTCELELNPSDALGEAHLTCAECKGVFFCDEGLAGYVVALTQASVEPVFRQLLETALAAAPQESTSIRACPLCRTKLERFGFGEQPLAILDWCPKDEAIWLDEGDLSKVIRICRSEALVLGALQDADPEPESTQEPPSEAEAPYACPNCARFFGGSKCPDCNVIGYLR
tara:strand:+ start:699 stop:1226 length:528 start_codon:yes stop_codon:yes gene_type:complete